MKRNKTLCISKNETFLEGLKNSLKSENLELNFFLYNKDNADELIKLTSSIDILVLHSPETMDHEFIQRFIKDQFKIMIIGPKTLNNVSSLIHDKINGYVYSEDSMEHIIKAIKLLAVQEKSFSNAVAQDLLNYSGLQDKSLTATEKKLINLIARGYDTNSIAEQVGCTANTIGVHKHNIKLKLNIKTKDFLQYCMKSIS
ncbi:LuxR C-terminal-related transcriptional regulator [Candidatus Pelagibacter sp.]|nr:LuxR C-terminal-related transcriptional regulator [Candidatus Pelagibacter sp.]